MELFSSTGKAGDLQQSASGWGNIDVSQVVELVLAEMKKTGKF